VELLRPDIEGSPLCNYADRLCVGFDGDCVVDSWGLCAVSCDEFEKILIPA
jgi:hypothetical protein